MLRAVSQKSRPARVGHRIPSGKLGQSQIQIRTKGFGIAASLSKMCPWPPRRLACPRCLPLADAEFFGAGGILIWRNQDARSPSDSRSERPGLPQPFRRSAPTALGPIIAHTFRDSRRDLSTSRPSVTGRPKFV
jgi:hypothetical protein